MAKQSRRLTDALEQLREVGSPAETTGTQPATIWTADDVEQINAVMNAAIHPLSIAGDPWPPDPQEAITNADERHRNTKPGQSLTEWVTEAEDLICGLSTFATASGNLGTWAREEGPRIRNEARVRLPQALAYVRRRIDQSDTREDWSALAKRIAKLVRCLGVELEGEQTIKNGRGRPRRAESSSHNDQTLVELYHRMMSLKQKGVRVKGLAHLAAQDPTCCQLASAIGEKIDSRLAARAIEADRREQTRKAPTK
jgi:hypothetical protein